MRRLRKVQMAASENFYRLLEKERERISSEMKLKYGFKKKISIFAVTELLAQKSGLGGGSNILFKNAKQKR